MQNRWPAHLVKLIFSILLAQGAGIIGAVFTAPNIDTWYALLAKPDLNPPSLIFGPVWTLLYTMIGIASYFVWTRHVGRASRAWWLRIYVVHLALNTLWSYLFFGLHNPLWALIDIAILWLMIAALIALAFRFERRAAYLLLPYLAWVSFASYLNYSIWILNP